MRQVEFQTSGFGLFGAEVFDSCSLGLHLCGGVIKKKIVFEATDNQVWDYSVRSQAQFCLCIDSRLHYLLKFDSFLVLLFYFNLNKRFEIFLEIADHDKLIGGPDKIELQQDKLEMLEMGCSVSDLF